MPKTKIKTKHLQEPGFSELVYTIAMAAPISVRRRLPERLFMATKSAKTARRFAATSSSEQKKEFLSYLGLKSWFVISNVDSIWATEFKELLKGVQKEQGSYDAMPENGIYVTSDKKLVTLMESMASFSISPAYRMSLELLRSQRKQSGWPTKLNKSEIDEVHEREAEYTSFAKMALAIEWALHGGELSYKLRPLELKMLLYLFLKKNSYVDHKDLVARFTGEIPKPEISNGERKLIEGLFIQHHADWRRNEYTITARGILFVSEILNHAAKLFNFNQ